MEKLKIYVRDGFPSLLFSLLVLLSLLCPVFLNSESASADGDGCTNTGKPGGYLFSLAWDGSGLFGGTDQGVWHYDPMPGNWSSTGGPGSCPQIECMAWDGSGLYAGCCSTKYSQVNGVYHYDPKDGTWTQVGGPLAEQCIDHLAWNGSGLYVAAGWGVWYYQPQSNTWADISGPLRMTQICSLAWDGTGLYAGTCGAGVLRYDPETGNWTNTGGKVSNYTIESLSWNGSTLYASGWLKLDEYEVWQYSPQTGTWAKLDARATEWNINDTVWANSHLYLATMYGVWSLDPQGSCLNLGGEVNNQAGVNSLAWDGSGLYAGTGDRGVWYFQSSSLSGDNVIQPMPTQHFVLPMPGKSKNNFALIIAFSLIVAGVILITGFLMYFLWKHESINKHQG